MAASQESGGLPGAPTEQQPPQARPQAQQPQQQEAPRSGLLSAFDRLPQTVQLAIMGGLLFFGLIVVPFLQPTFLYGDGSMDASIKQPGVTNVQEAAPPARYSLPRYIPGASELYDFLQDNAMPRTLPDGRSESPGVLRIYMSSLIILGLFYVCSAIVGTILRGVAGILRAVGVVRAAPPPRPEA